MYLYFDTPEIISITEIDNGPQQADFFSSLAELIPVGTILGVGCYAPDPQVQAWFATLPLLEVPDDFNFRREFEIYREDYPSGGAFYLAATNENLATLVRLAKAVGSPELLSDHVIGFIRQPLFSFHDWDEMLISLEIGSEKVAAFCRRLDVTYKRIRNPQLL